MSQIEIIPYSSEHAAEVADLLNAGLATKLVGVRDVQYWNWKHEQNPFGRSLMLLAWADGRAVGIRAFMRWDLRFDGAVIHAAKPVDSVTHPDYQRRGIFSRLTQAACSLATQQGLAFLFNTPNQNSKPGYLKLGWHEVGDLSVHAKIMRPVSAVRNAIRWKWRQQVPQREKFFADEPQTAGSVFADDRVQDLLSDRLTATEQLETERSWEFLRWRYVGHPHIEYFAETLEQHGRLQGMVLYRTNVRHGLREIMITDLLVPKTDYESIVSRLLGELKAKSRADYWLVQADGANPVSQLLRRHGFRTVPKKRISLVARALHPDGLPIPELERWSLSFGDLEGL